MRVVAPDRGRESAWVTVLRIVLAVAVALSFTFASPAQVSAAVNPIVTENQQPGTGAWVWGSKISDDATGQIKGYASATSVAANQNLTLYVTVNPAQTYTIDFYRIGWYGGSGGRLRLHVGPLSGVKQSPCTPNPTTGLIACAWTPSYNFAIPSDWTSGLYLAKLINAQGYENYVAFVVRDGRPAPFLYQHSVTTSQAYNNYPDDKTTGKSLYAYQSYGASTIAGDPRAVKVSFDRPFTEYGFGQWDDFNTIRWLERSGYDVTYLTDIDTHQNGAELRRHRVFLSTGHDEYWSKEMYDAVESARDVGVNLAFLGANAAYWQVRFEPSASGVPDRVMVCYKNAAIDPVQGPTTTVMWRQSPLNRPEQTLIGVQFTSDIDNGLNVGYRVITSAHWVYAGTGLRDGDVVPGIVGYEMDRLMPEFPAAKQLSGDLLSDSPYINKAGAPDHANSSIYQAPSGALVFASGTMSWVWGLDNFLRGREDSRIQRTMANIFDGFINGPPAQVAALAVSAPATVTAGQSFNVTVTARDYNGATVPSYAGTVHFATSDPAPNVVLPPDSPLTNGAGTFALTLRTAGQQSITVSDAANGLSTTQPLTVSAPSASRFALATTDTPIAGTSFSFTVTALTDLGDVDPSYAGKVHFTSTDTSSGVVLPSDSTLTAGRGTFSAKLNRSGSQTITATDTVTASMSGALTVNVRGGSASRLALATTATPRAGTAFSFTVTAQDQFGNVDPSYAGTVRFTSTDTSTGVVLPPNTALSGGQGTFSATLIKSGPQSITATDTVTSSTTGTLGVNVGGASATRLVLTTAGTATAGVAFPFTATALDQYGNVDTGYAGTVRFTSTDTSTGVVLPANATLTNGARTFSATLAKAGPQTITGTDTVTASISGTVAVQVSAGLAAVVSVQAPSSAVSGQRFSFTVTLRDAGGNVAAGYTGTMHFTSNDGAFFTDLPPDYRFTAADAGSHTFDAILWNAGDKTITATDTAKATLTGTATINIRLV
jgi:hypothetical protein